MTPLALIEEARRFRKQAQDLQDSRPKLPQGHEANEATIQEWLNDVQAWEKANRWRLVELWEQVDALEAIVGGGV